MSRDRDRPPESFADLFDDAKRLDGPTKRAPGRGRRRVRKPASNAGRKSATSPFRTPDPERPHLAARSGTTDQTLAALARGEPPPEERIDLHGLDRTGAPLHLARSLQSASARGLRCVLVVHGRGRRSADEGVLRAALPGWLTGRICERFVLAFAPARPRDGGEGATYVLMRGD